MLWALMSFWIAMFRIRYLLWVCEMEKLSEITTTSRKQHIQPSRMWIFLQHWANIAQIVPISPKPFHLLAWVFSFYLLWLVNQHLAPRTEHELVSLPACHSGLFIIIPTAHFSSLLGTRLLCQHYFEHNRCLKALSIMLAWWAEFHGHAKNPCFSNYRALKKIDILYRQL